MKRKNGIFGLSLIAAALACHAVAPTKNPIAKAEGDPPESGAPSGNTTISILELENLRVKAAKVQAVEEGLNVIGELITKHFPDRIKEGETALSISAALIREHAEKVAGKSASNAIVEGSSAKIVDENGKGNAEVYVLGVNKEKGVAAIYGTPPKLVQLKTLAPLKRGYAIAGHEVALREKTWPDAKWDVRED